MITQDQAFQFKLCGIIQLILDTFVILQVIYYNMKVKVNEAKEDDGEKKSSIETKEDNNYELENSISRSIVMSEGIEKETDESAPTESHIG